MPGARWFWHRQLKKPFFGRFMKPWRWPQGVPADGWERTSFPSASHATLAAVWKRAPAAEPRGVVVCAHPMGLAAKGFWLRNGHADALLEAGFHVMSFDFNGFGDSPSTNFDWPADALAAGRHARQLFPGLPVHALCASFGAMHMLNALGADDFPFERIVTEGCASSLPEFWKHYPFANAVLRMGSVVAPESERRLRPVLAMTRLPVHVRVLLVHSQGDRWTPTEHGDRLAAAVPPGRRVERLTLAKAEHTHGMRDEREAYWPAVHKFLTVA
ncbi:MAG: alpha/beta hydrolase [Rubrivivax sp.]|nr:MAG: alpha/beta hydrolase [Rubrivivax sp.]